VSRKGRERDEKETYYLKGGGKPARESQPGRKEKEGGRGRRITPLRTLRVLAKGKNEDILRP